MERKIRRRYRGVAIDLDLFNGEAMEYSTLLGALASELKLPSLEPDEFGRCSIEIDGMPLTMCCTPEGNAVALVAQVGDVNPRDAALLEELLAANLAHTSGMRLGVDGNHSVLLMHWSPLANLEFAQFLRTLEDFANCQAYWIDRLNPAPALAAA